MSSEPFRVDFQPADLNWDALPQSRGRVLHYGMEHDESEIERANPLTGSNRKSPSSANSRESRMGSLRRLTIAGPAHFPWVGACWIDRKYICNA